jgi:hypothetical protein
LLSVNAGFQFSGCVGLRVWRLVGTDGLYAAAVANGLVADDGERQCWATIRSGLGAGLQQPADLDADDRALRRKRTSRTMAAG